MAQKELELQQAGKNAQLKFLHSDGLLETSWMEKNQQNPTSQAAKSAIIMQISK